MLFTRSEKHDALSLVSTRWEEGGKTMRVEHVMTKNVICCVPTNTAQEAAQLMARHSIGALPVITAPHQAFLEGIVTDRDLCCKVLADAKSAEGTVLAGLMTRDPVTCTPQMGIDDCEKLMKRHSLRRIPVVDTTGCCIGIVSEVDIESRPAQHKARKVAGASVSGRTRA
jgi:CBS domain-containing protein